MATNLAIDNALPEEALAQSGERTKKAAVTKAIEELMARRHQKRIRTLFGQLECDSAYDREDPPTRHLALVSARHGRRPADLRARPETRR